MKPEEKIPVRRWECYSPPDDELPERGHEKTLRDVTEWVASKSIVTRGLLVVALMVIIAELMILSPALFDSVYHLFGGWLFFAWETVPQIRLNALAIVNGIIGLVVVCTVLHWLLAKWSGGKGTQREPWRWRWTFSVAAVVAAMFGICVVTVGLVTSVGWAAVPHSITTLGTPREQNRYHARSLVEFARYDAERQNGRLPDERPGIYGGEGDLFTQFYHEDLSQPPECFIWLGEGLGVSNTPGDVPIVAAPHPYRDGTRLVAFLDESVVECTEEEWQAALARWRQAKEAADRANKPEGK